MPSHPDRVRRNSPEVNCKHLWIYHMNSDVAPFIEEDGSRTTIKLCANCGIKEKYNRPQIKFEFELKKLLID